MSEQAEVESPRLAQLDELWRSQRRHFMGRRCYTTKTMLEGSDINPVNLQDLEDRIRSNKFLQYWKKHTLQQSDAGALGEVSRVVVEAATPMLFAREMCWVVETTESKVRYPKAIKGTAYRRKVGGTGPTEIKGESYDFADIEVDEEIIYHAKFSDSFLEDAAWPAVQRQTAEGGRAVAEAEAEYIITDQYGGIADADLAGGGTLTLSAAMTAADLTDLATRVRAEDYSPDAAFMHPNEFGELKKDANFIDSLRWGESLDKERGEMARTIDGLRIFVSTKIPAGTVYVADTRWACGLAIRRDLVTEPYDKRDELASGVVISSRVGAAILRTKAVAKGV